MSVTDKAILAEYRQQPFHPNYLEIAEIYEAMDPRERIRQERMCTTCPFCGSDGRLEAKVSVGGGKDTFDGIEIAEDGIQLTFDVGEKMVEMRLAICTCCDAAIEPIMLQSPHVAVRRRKSARRILTGS